MLPPHVDQRYVVPRRPALLVVLRTLPLRLATRVFTAAAVAFRAFFRVAFAFSFFGLLLISGFLLPLPALFLDNGELSPPPLATATLFDVDFVPW